MKKFLSGIVLFVFLCVLFCACEKKSSTAYVFTPGKALQYRLWVNQQIESDGDINNAVRISMRADFEMTPVSVAPDGEAELKLVFKSASATATTGDQRKKIDMEKSLINKEIFLKMKRNGEIGELRLPELENRNQYSNLTKLQHVVMDMFTTLPANLNNGTAWTRKTIVEEDFRPFGIVSTETKTSFVAGPEVEVWQQKATEIAINFDVRLGSEVEKENKSDSTPEDGLPQSIRVGGGGTGSGKMYFDIKSNTCIGAAYETAVEMKTEMLFADVTKNSTSSQKIKTGIVLKFLPENGAK